jgi:hypothetical protein
MLVLDVRGSADPSLLVTEEISLAKLLEEWGLMSTAYRGYAMPCRQHQVLATQLLCNLENREGREYSRQHHIGQCMSVDFNFDAHRSSIFMKLMTT